MDDERHGGHEPANWRSHSIISYGMLLNAYGTAYLTTLDRHLQFTNSEMHVPHFMYSAAISTLYVAGIQGSIATQLSSENVGNVRGCPPRSLRDTRRSSPC
ncbi:hypothetical protein LZ32DRAFT_692735 [Colletotrichum eremochloae]|nr:hypothetical protein LZ32DRAFT_692735 [Colletotrichum eremochloae]